MLFRSSKAYYRSALALLALERPEEALDCCSRCLSYDSDNTNMQAVKQRVEDAKIKKDEKQRKRQEYIRTEQESERKLKAAFRVGWFLFYYQQFKTPFTDLCSKERYLILLPKPDGSSNPMSPAFDPEDQTGRTLIFPVFFLYPQYANSDVISQFVESTSFAAHILVMFPPQAPPPSWDVKHQYISGELVIYAMTHRKRLLKVGKKMTLRDVFNASKAKEGDPPDGLELKDGCLSFVVLPKGDEEKKWVEEYLTRRQVTQ